jgi:hypothetical protein
VATSCERERKREEGGNGRGFKYPRICVGSDIVQASWTLSSKDSIQGEVANLKELKNEDLTDCIVTKQVYIYI